MQWHQRLGHPSLSVIRKIIPSMSKQCSNASIFCEACEFGKHTNTFLAFNKRSHNPFMIVHLDDWGSSKVRTLAGYS